MPSIIAPVRRARALLVAATVLWGLSFPIVRGLELAQHFAAPEISYTALACADMAFRFLLAALFLLPFFGRVIFTATSREWSQASGLAVFAGAGLYLQTLGLSWTDASVSAFLTQLYSLLVPLVVAFRDRRWPTLRTVTACLLVLVGAATLSPGLMAHFRPAFGELIIIISTGFIAGQIVWVERPRYAANRAGLVTFIMFAQMGGVFAMLFPFLGGQFSHVGRLFDESPIVALMLNLVLFCTVANFFIMNKWQRWISATEAGLIYCLEPVIATILASFMPAWISLMTGVAYANELLSWTLLIGGALIVAATILVATERRGGTGLRD